MRDLVGSGTDAARQRARTYRPSVETTRDETLTMTYDQLMDAHAARATADATASQPIQT